MKSTKITATYNAKDKEGKVIPETKGRKFEADVQLPADLDEAANVFGADVVFGKFNQKLIIDAQAAMRTLAENGKNDDEIQAEMASWNPSVTISRKVDAQTAVLREASSMTPEQRREFITKLAEALEAQTPAEAVSG